MADEGAALTFGLLGSVAAWHGDRPVRLGGLRRRTVLAALMLDAGRPIAVDRLVDAVWDEAPPPTARKALQVHVMGLRRAIAEFSGVELMTVNSGYMLNVAPDRIDLHRFRRLVAQAQQSQPRRAAGLLHDALALRRGPALADLCGQAWADRAAIGIDEEVLAAVERRIDADLALGRHADLVPELTTLVADQPLRERPRGQLMLALYRSGRTADAVAAFRDIREALVGDVGIEPGPELQRLHRAMLNADPDLTPSAGWPPGSDVVRTP